jgi:hypothetical protein
MLWGQGPHLPLVGSRVVLSSVEVRVVASFQSPTTKIIILSGFIYSVCAKILFDTTEYLTETSNLIYQCSRYALMAQISFSQR